MRGPRAVPGEIRYTKITGANGKITLKKEKYYYWVLSFGNLTYDTYLSYDSGYAGNENSYQTNILYYPGLTEQIYQFSPDRNADFSKINSHFFKKLINSKWVINLDSITILEDYTVEKDYIQENDFGDFIDGLAPGTYFTWFNRSTTMKGYAVYDAWASYKEKEETEPKSAPPNALDKDWTLEEVKEKQDEIQQWVDNNLYPPIFGPTNCVYFPSNLGNLEPDKPGEQNPVIKSYPAKGSIFIQSGDTYEYYGMSYPVSSNFQIIKCQKDEQFTINCNFPFIITSERFEIIQDNYLDETTDDSVIAVPPRNKSYYSPELFKVNQIINIRFIEPEAAADSKLTRELKFNQYSMQAIILSIDLPDEKSETSDVFIKKYSITFKFINDLGLTKDKYFNAKLVITGELVSNYVQNETFSIQRYYKKELGSGPRLGGSVMLSNSNLTEGDFKHNGLYLFTTVLKDEEKLNKPYLGIGLTGSYITFSSGSFSGISNYDLTHQFSEDDLKGKFKTIGNQDTQIIQYEDKQYLSDYTSYVIKNLDEHTYEYYQNLKKSASPYYLFNFRESNENADLTFGSYE